MSILVTGLRLPFDAPEEQALGLALRRCGLHGGTASLYRRSIDALLDLGFLNEGNLYAVIEKVGAVQDAAMTGYLLEAKRQRFGGGGLDFDL